MITDKSFEDSDRHIYLYAKGHYKQSENVFDDLKFIMAERSGIKPENVSLLSIYLVLENVTNKIYNREYGDNTDIAIRRYNDAIMFTAGSDDDKLKIVEMLIKAFLSVISLSVMVCDKWEIDLGEPDSKILPLREDK